MTPATFTHRSNPELIEQVRRIKRREGARFEGFHLEQTRTGFARK